MFGPRSPFTWVVAQDLAAPLLAVALIAAATPPVDGPDDAPPAALTADADTLETAAIAVAHELRAVPADDSDRLCARDELAVSWQAPQGFTHGAHIAPVGPRPVLGSTSVNGVVVCGDSTWAYMGFEAQHDADGWNVTPVPYVEESHEHGEPRNLDADPDAHRGEHGDDHDGDGEPHDEEATGDGHAARDGGDGVAVLASALPSPSAPTRNVSTGAWLDGLGPIEPYARHEAQTTCSPTAKPGTVVLRDTLLGVHRATRNLGIARACHIGGRSEHKEGRAFDWGAYVNRPVERASVDRFLGQLMATDADGNRHALARRLGVMYVIWNGRIWSASRANEGWRRYYGPSPHTDHVHISLNWAGARAQTSFFTKGLAQAGVLGLVPPGVGEIPTSGAGGSAPTPSTSPTGGTATPTRTTRPPSPTRTSGGTTTRDGGSATPAPTGTSGGSSPSTSSGGGSTRDAEAAREAEEQRRREEQQRKAVEEERRRQERQRKEAEEQARRAEEQVRRAEEAARREAERQRKAEEQQQRLADQQRREEEQARRRAEQDQRRSEGGGNAGGGKGRGKKG